MARFQIEINDSDAYSKGQTQQDKPVVATFAKQLHSRGRRASQHEDGWQYRQQYPAHINS